VSPSALPHFDAVPLFQCLNADERKLLAPVSRVVVYEKGEEIFREGQPATDLCFVVIGRVKIVKAAPEREFFATIDGHPEMTRRLLQGLMLRQFEISRRLADLMGSVEKRIARLLLMLTARVGHREGAGATIPLVLSRQDIADLTATTVESAIRVMSRWGKENVVITGPEGFSIPDLQALQTVTKD